MSRFMESAPFAGCFQIGIEQEGAHLHLLDGICIYSL
jgi:hypothetical protein